MTANSKLTLTEAKIANHKLCLFISTLLSFAINLLMLITIARGGFGFGYILLPMIICIIDVAFVVVAAFTNFRFAYSTVYTTVFSLIFAATTLIFALVLLNIGKGTAITLVAFLLWIICSAFSIAVIIIGASRAGKNRGAIKSVVALAILLVSIGAYAVSLFGNGFFGQGNEKYQRPVSFVYDSEKEYYVATGIMRGRGKTAVIPETFNDVKVGAIDCALFLDSKIKTVSIMTDADVEFTNTEALTAGIPDIECLASKSLITAYASKLYDLVKDTGAESNAICSLASKFVPSDLSGDEIYVTFSYSPESIICSGGEYIPMWIGNKNDVFSFGYAEDCNYLKYSDINDESVLSTIYNAKLFNGGNVLSTVTLPSGTPLVGQVMTESVDNVEIKFEKVYRVKILDDNDGLYEVENSFRYLNSISDRYRYVTSGTADSLLSEVADRTGFTLNWVYGYSNMQSLSSILDTRVREYSIKPTWTLDSPEFTSFKTNTNDTTYVYGDRMAFDVGVEEPTEDTVLEYVWYKDGEEIYNGSDYSVDTIQMSNAGRYRLEIIATTPTTTLSSKAINEINIAVNKKVLNISWVGFDAGESFTKTYDAEDFAPEITYNSNEFVSSSDEAEFDYYFGTSNIRIAGDHNVSVYITGDCADKYELSMPNKLYKINRKEVDIEWSSAPIYYNALTQTPGATITSGIIGSDYVYVITSATDNINAGEHTARATLGGSESGNYMLKSAQSSYKYNILPATININWSNVSQTYQGQKISPTATPVGLLGSDTVGGLNLKVTDAKSAGIHEITVTIGNGNYVISAGDEKTSFEILPAPLTVSFSNTKQTYNSGVLKPGYSVSGLCSSDTVAGLGLSIDGGTNVGVYALTLTLTDTNYVLSNPTISNFEIVPATIKVTWNSNQNLTYNAEGQYLGIQKVEGIYAGDKSHVTVKVDVASSTNVNCGKYNAYALLEDTSGHGNYVISEATQKHEYSIVQASLSLAWTNVTFTYDKTSKLPTATLSTAPFGSDTVNVTVTGAKTDAGTYTATANTSNPNYKFSNPTTRFTINPKEITVSWSNTSFTYDGQNHAPVATLTGTLYSGDTTTINVSGAKKNAGTYTATANTSNQNYKVSTATATQSFTIAKREITVSWSNTSPVYNRSNQHPTATVSSGLVSGDSVTFTYAGAQKNAGNGYTATATSANSNYVVTNATCSFSIQPKTITVSWSNTTRTYTGGALKPTAKLSGVISGDSVQVTVSVGGSTSGKTAVGTYNAVATINNSNYVLDANTSTVTFTIVAQAPKGKKG